MELLKTFYAIVDHDTLKELRAIINVPKEVTIVPDKTKIPLQQYKVQQINKIQT